VINLWQCASLEKSYCKKWPVYAVGRYTRSLLLSQWWTQTWQSYFKEDQIMKYERRTWSTLAAKCVEMHRSHWTNEVYKHAFCKSLMPYTDTSFDDSQYHAINSKNKNIKPFLNIAFQNICWDGYTQHSLSLSARGIVDISLSVDNGNGWSGDGLWFGGGICHIAATGTKQHWLGNSAGLPLDKYEVLNTV